MKTRCLVVILLALLVALYFKSKSQHQDDMNRESLMNDKIAARDGMIEALGNELARKPHYQFCGYDMRYGFYDIRSFDRMTWYLVDPKISKMNKKAIITGLADEYWPDWRQSPNIQKELKKNPELKGIPEVLSRLTEYQKEVADRAKFVAPSTNQTLVVGQQ